MSEFPKMSWHDALPARDQKCREIEEAFKRAQVGTRYEQYPLMPYDCVNVWINYGYRGQRRVLVIVDNDLMCRVYMTTDIRTVPDDKASIDDVLANKEQIPLLFELPGDTPDLANEIVRRTREATVRDE